MSGKIVRRIAASCIAAVSIISLCAFSLKTSTSEAAVSSVYGDVNGDGEVNIIDSIYMKQNALFGKREFPITNWRAAASLNGTDNIDGNIISINKEQIIGGSNAFAPVKKLSFYNGIDVSKWQGVIDWNRVRAAGIDFVMIKAGEGTRMESTFLRNITGAKSAGIQCGVYWFANARNIDECKAEARACLDTIKNYQLEYPVVYDFEYRTLNNNPLSTDRAMCTEVMYTFLEDIEKAGYYPMVYSNKDFPQRYINLQRLTERFDFWYANYSLIEPDVPCGIWQRSCTGRVDGISTDVDLDISYVDYKSVMVLNGVNGY